ncbi:P-loop NTPase fold protein [Mastigocoleus testarum]|nr:P-loop NTPase fold protein [Mastigocoleus testarum]
MSQENISPNNHIEEYLDYYCSLFCSPKLAVLLKGEWGCGKTWFINQYREKLKSQNKKSLYVSLYGVNSYSEIEDSPFQQLHPILASKQMVIAGKVFKGFLKGALKIDLNMVKMKGHGLFLSQR